MRFLFILALTILTHTSFSQTTELIPYGDFESWLNRDIDESFVIGGNTRRIYAIAPKNTIKGPIPYRRGVSPWSTSNALAIVAMVTKTSNTVFPESRIGSGGMCAKMESSLASCKVLGVVNITVMVCGSIFLGETIEPIKNTDNPYSKLDMGIPFTKQPKALLFDYNTAINTSGTLITAKGWSVNKSKGADYAQVFVALQNRKELADGSIVAERVATGKEYLTKSSHGWINDHRLPIHYGNIENEAFYKSYMGLTNFYYAKNSKGNMVKVIESGWAAEGTPVTHAIVFMSSGSHEAFVGAMGNVFRVDNVKFEY